MKEERRLSQKQAKEGKKAGKMISLRSGIEVVLVGFNIVCGSSLCACCVVFLL